MKIKSQETAYVKKADSQDKKQGQKKDILHDTPVRYLGYCDDIGAATKVICNNSTNALIKNLPVISYIPVAGYIGADVLMTYNTAKKTEGEEAAKKKALSQGVFQGITSLLFPIGIVGAAQKAAGKVFDNFHILKQNFAEDGAKIINRRRDIALVLVGLGALLAVSKYADRFAKNVLMDKIINPAIGIKENKEEKCVECAEKTDVETTIGTTQA